MFIWRMMLKGLPVDENVKRVGISLASKCLCCGSQEETHKHLFFHSTWATQMWGELKGAFLCEKPSSPEVFVQRWCKAWNKNNSFSSFKLGMACYGMWEIWKARNSMFHDEGGYNPAILMYWARMLISVIPGVITENKGMKFALHYFNILDMDRPVLGGKWCRWKPELDGVCMNVHLSKGNVGAAVIRSGHGSLHLAIIKKVNGLTRKDLMEFIYMVLENADTKYGINVDEIQSSHYDMINMVKNDSRVNFQTQVFRDVVQRFSIKRMKRIHTAMNNATICLTYNRSKEEEISNIESLPLVVRRCLRGDALGLQVFCGKDAQQEQMNVQTIFRDDTGIG